MAIAGFICRIHAYRTYLAARSVRLARRTQSIARIGAAIALAAERWFSKTLQPPVNSNEEITL
jgi:hypothetical protein